MRIALFVPCYVDRFFPKVAISTFQVLKKLGYEPEVPSGQTCCGQPLGNSGFEAEAKEVADHFDDLFADYDYVVGPSGSCVDYAVEHHGEKEGERRIYELSEFLSDVAEMPDYSGTFDWKVGLHQSCHGLRNLRLGSSSETVSECFSKPGSLLAGIPGLELVELERKDECCGFGGAFCVDEADVSAKMGKDRLADHERSGTEVLTAVDMSCLMHLKGLIDRKKSGIKVMHIAEIINEAL
ncbi:Fe-S oxidoreductase [Fulvitalea axinellae]|uniref:Fe-S oxidoreductase n=1 Tax=Fulvitalea axinellae TaxID=1182444 RepID=A0AAU9CJG9_9BACT|nr:Fe-S oxidoreductase [Fulvitalea axinellae]